MLLGAGPLVWVPNPGWDGNTDDPDNDGNSNPMGAYLNELNLGSLTSLFQGSPNQSSTPNDYLSVLSPNYQRPTGTVPKYLSFLTCEAGITIHDLGDAAPASYGALATGAVGVQQMYTFLYGTTRAIRRAGLARGVPVIGEMAALYDVVMMNVEAVRANQACTATIYGH